MRTWRVLDGHVRAPKLRSLLVDHPKYDVDQAAADAVAAVQIFCSILGVSAYDDVASGTVL